MTQQQIEIAKKDRMKYKGNALSANLSLLAIVLNAFYFVVVYKINYNNQLYDLLLGISVVYNLLFMLVVFLASTKVKAYDMVFSIILLALALGQIVRIFILPTTRLANGIILDDDFKWMVIWLIASSVVLVGAGVVGILKSINRRHYIEAVDKGEIDLSFLSERS